MYISDLFIGMIFATCWCGCMGFDLNLQDQKDLPASRCTCWVTNETVRHLQSRNGSGPFEPQRVAQEQEKRGPGKARLQIAARQLHLTYEASMQGLPSEGRRWFFCLKTIVDEGSSRFDRAFLVVY